MSARILYIDDEEDLLEVISSFFGEEGIPVETCDDLGKARELVIGNKYDLIISDLNMPSGSAFDFLETVIQQGHFSGKVVIVSGAVEEVPRLVDMVIHKPFDFDDLLGKIKSLVSI